MHVVSMFALFHAAKHYMNFLFGTFSLPFINYTIKGQEARHRYPLVYEQSLLLRHGIVSLEERVRRIRNGMIARFIFEEGCDAVRLSSLPRPSKRKMNIVDLNAFVRGTKSMAGSARGLISDVTNARTK